MIALLGDSMIEGDPFLFGPFVGDRLCPFVFELCLRDRVVAGSAQRTCELYYPPSLRGVGCNSDSPLASVESCKRRRDQTSRGVKGWLRATSLRD